MISSAELVRRQGERYAPALGIDLAADSGGSFKWFLAAILCCSPYAQTCCAITAPRFADFGAAPVREGLRLNREEFRHGSSNKETT